MALGPRCRDEPVARRAARARARAPKKSASEQFIPSLCLPEQRRVQLPPPAPGFGQDNLCSGSSGG